MIKKLIVACVVASSLFLVGCKPSEPVQLVRTEIKVVDIPTKFLDMCPELRKNLPNYSSLTDKQLANLITYLWGHSQNCRNAMLGIYEHQRIAKSGLENKPIY